MRIDRVDVETVRPLRHRVLRPGMAWSTTHLPGDDAAVHFAARVGGEVVGCVSMMTAPLPGPDGRGDDRQLRGMAVDGRFRRQGLGVALVAAVVAAAPGRVWCESRLAAVSLYERAGFSPVGEVHDVPVYGPHRRMVRPADSA